MIELFDKIKLRYFILTIIILFISQVLRFFEIITNYNVSIVLSIFGLIGLIIYILDIIFTKRKIDKYDILIYILIFIGIISSIFAINFKDAIFGFKNRNEGLFILITYYIFFLNTKTITNKKYRNIIFNLLLSYGLFNSIYGICQYFRVKNIFGIIPITNYYSYYSTAFETNSNFFSTISITSLFLVLPKYLFDNKKSSYIYGISSIIFFMGLLCSGAMSGALTFMVTSILLIIMLFIKKIRIVPTIIKIVLLVISFIICFNSFNKYNHNYLSGQVINMGSEFTDITKGNFNDKYGTGRIHIWKETLKIVPDYIVTGTGPDNFFYGFKDKPLIDVKSHLKVDKAHNEYLQKLVTEGIFSFITYLTLLIMIFISGIKNIIKNRKKDSNILLISLFFGFIAYSIQAFFNISVICVAPIFYIIMGLAVGEVYEED